MSARLNLASEPFGNRALPWTITAIVTLCSLIALVLILRETGKTNAAIAAVRNDVTTFEQQMGTIRQKAEQVKIALTSEQLQTLESAHTLVERKRFSWSLLFADLEASLPGSVRVTRISVKDVIVRGDQTAADLELTVISRNATTITQMIADMESAGIFQAELVSQNLQKGRGEIGTEYVMNVRYLPRRGVPTSSESTGKVAAMESSSLPADGGRR